MPQGLPTAFTSDGLLPTGDYEVTLPELRASMLVIGPLPAIEGWDAEHRLDLVNKLDVLVNQLWDVGITEIYIDGSFTTYKIHPDDIDGYFVCQRRELKSGMIQARLNDLDPYRVWTWERAARRPAGKFKPPQLPMWHQYHVELHAHYTEGFGAPPIAGVDKTGRPLDFPAFFRQDKDTGKAKGIVRIVKEDLQHDTDSGRISPDKAAG